MSAQFVIALVVAAPVVVLVLSVGRMARRMLRRNEESESGGSHGQQILPPTKD
jgi:hypothetical protein